MTIQNFLLPKQVAQDHMLQFLENNFYRLQKDHLRELVTLTHIF